MARNKGLKKANVKPGSFIMIKLDSAYAYARVRNDGDLSFYDFFSNEPINDLDLLSSKSIFYTIPVIYDGNEKWTLLGVLPLEESLVNNPVYYAPDIIPSNPINYRLMKEGYLIEHVNKEECVGLEVFTILQDVQMEDILEDKYNGVDNKRFLKLQNNKIQ